MKTTGNTMLITGAGSGIGRELARAFSALGNTVIAAGRRRETLEETIGGRAGMSAMVLDVDDRHAIAEFAARLVAAHPAVNVLVNNAGIMRAEDLLAQPSDLADAEATITTNLLGPIRMTAALLPQLRTQPSSAIVNVSSGLAFVPLVITPTYSATKAALHSYTVSLRHRLRGTTTEVIEIVPPGVQTDLMPGQGSNPHLMPLADFISETMALFQRQPTPSEICVERVGFLRRAEAEGRADATLDMLNGTAG